MQLVGDGSTAGVGAPLAPSLLDVATRRSQHQRLLAGALEPPTFAAVWDTSVPVGPLVAGHVQYTVLESATTELTRADVPAPALSLMLRWCVGVCPVHPSSPRSLWVARRLVSRAVSQGRRRTIARTIDRRTIGRTLRRRACRCCRCR